MKCPHCATAFHNDVVKQEIGVDKDGLWSTHTSRCPACSRFTIQMVGNIALKLPGDRGNYPGPEIKRYLVRPKVADRPKPPSSVPAEFVADYEEAALVLSDSAKASAALSRRCLQHLLREKAGVKKADLAKEIEEVISSGKLPSHLAEAIDAVRNIGNFAAHPIKASATGEVLPVEPGEAEWTLDVLDGLFDFYFVQPELLKARRAALDAKLASANKPPVK